jgi:type IV secretion system protein VirD4
LREHRSKLEAIDPWAYARFDQYLASSKSDETASSIAGTAQNLFGQFCDEEIVPSLIGKTSFPLHLEGRKLLIIGATPRLRKTVSPLLMALLSQIVEVNAHQGRETPLQIAIDELPLVNYPRLITDINEIRKYGVFFNLAAQTLSQMKSQMGNNDTESLLTGAGTKCWFNTRSNDTAQYLETALGNQKYRETQYTSGSSGGRGNSSTSKQIRERKLLSVAQIVKLPQGTMVVQNRGFSSRTEEYIPWKVKTKPDKTYVAMVKWASKQWPHTQSQLIRFSAQMPSDSSLLRLTREAAENLLPAPKSQGQREAAAIVERERVQLLKQLF